MRLSVSENSYIGMRSQQEDALDYLQTDDFVRAIVCDGIGGLIDGDAASAIAVKVFNSIVTPEAAQSVSISELLINAIDEMDYEVTQLLPNQEQGARPGTTMTAAVIKGSYLYWASVGDSRLYIIRDGEMMQVTRDHTFRLTMDYLYRNGFVGQDRIDYLQKKASSLTSYIGIGGVELYDLCVHPFVLQEGDILLLTTDGLYKTISDDQLLKLLSCPMTAKDLSEQLMAYLMRYMTKHQDNTSYIVIKSEKTGG